jgi:hypothetical protein
MATKIKDVKVGQTWVAKVSGKLVRVQIKEELPTRWSSSPRPYGSEKHGGWRAVNLATGKVVWIKSPQRLRYQPPAAHDHVAEARSRQTGFAVEQLEKEAKAAMPEAFDSPEGDDENR